MSSKKHTQKRPKRFTVSQSVTDGAILAFLSDLNCPRSLTCWMLYKYKEHQQLVDLECNPLNYTCRYKFRDDYLATSFLSKYQSLDIAVDKDTAALEKFWKFEKQCQDTNFRLRHPNSDPLSSGLNASLYYQLGRKISLVLGDFVAEEFVESLAWGPGVSTLIKGNKTSGSHKFQFETGITSKLYPWFTYLKMSEQVHPIWHKLLTASDGTYTLCEQWGNTICTVPKNSKTNRVIAVEPGINMLCQKAAGTMIRKRLLRQGINLRDQRINQELCKYALDRDLATVDFSSASDSISRVLIDDILPPKWSKLLSFLRSPCYVSDDGSPVPWEKYSSMGNGFTFELESLVFFCAASVVMTHLGLEGRPSVYGDDVIIPTEAYELYASFCKYLGFTVNLEKSFSSGLFRESCGVHYFDGLDVQPIFLKEKISNVQGVYKLANSVRLLAHRRNSYCGCDSRFRRTHRYLQLRVQSHLRFLVPPSNPQAGFISNFDEARPSIRRAGRGWDGFRYSGLLTVASTYIEEHDGYFVSKIWGLNNGEITPFVSNDVSDYIDYIDIETNGVIAQRPNETAFRSRVSFRRHDAFYTPRHKWYNLGGWV